MSPVKMVMIKKNIKKLIASILISTLIFNEASFAGQFIIDALGTKRYLNDNGFFAVGWQWIDTNDDNICECYRFMDDGALATRSRIKGKDVNKDGQWVVNGIIQRIYKTTGKPLYDVNAALGENDTNVYIELGTDSGTRRLNATKKDIKDKILADWNYDEKMKQADLAGLIGPKASFEKPDEGYVVSKGALSATKKRPVATISTFRIIDDAIREDEVKYLAATESLIAGKDARRFVESSYKYTEKCDNVKIWGGEIWNDCICLSGNGSYVKFNLIKEKEGFQANYVQFEVAHQTHGESTADTDCALEMYLNGDSVGTYDSFADSEPELVEEWFDEGETTMELKAIITGDAPGRKIYIRNIRFRQIKEKEEKDDKKK